MSGGVLSSRPRLSYPVWIIAVAVSTLLLAGIFLTIRFEKLIIYNPTPSVQTGFYVYDGHKYEPGSIILFKTPSIVKDYTEKYFSKAPLEHFLKPVLAKEGDHVCYKNGAFYLNGEAFAGASKEDSAGHPLPLWQECRIMRAGEYFVFSDLVENSFDSRYYGPVPKESIIGSFVLLF